MGADVPPKLRHSPALDVLSEESARPQHVHVPIPTNGAVTAVEGVLPTGGTAEALTVGLKYTNGGGNDR